MIYKTAHFAYHQNDAKTFTDEITRAIKSMQEEGLTVEIQYHPVTLGNSIVFTAFVIGRAGQ